MKTQISSLDLHYLIEELQILKDARIDKIYHPKKEELLLQFHVTSKGKTILRIISGKFLFLTENKESYAEPSGFCMFLRKKLGSARLREAKQIGSERVALLKFSTKEQNYNLYIELFGKGNIILTDEENIIINVLQQKRWADRTIKKSEEYIFPKKENNFFEIKKQAFFKLLDSDKELVYKLAKDLGLGGTYSEEICLLSKIDKNKIKLDEKEKETIYKVFDKLRKNKIKSSIVYKNKKVKDIIPFSLESYKDLEQKPFPSLSSAFDDYYKQFLDKDEFISKHQQNIDKTLSILNQQKKQLKNLEKKAIDENRKGEILYEKYQLVDEILREIKKAREKLSFKEIKAKLKGHNIIKEINEKNKTIKVELLFFINVLVLNYNSTFIVLFFSLIFLFKI
jgi:predicted ribosome quality control (RQC) complex YloA/Tae2 family protein